ncbi:chromosome segregation protein SMC [Algibacillus agarilyticus]|uniref:chromosome segregation protein SMC n=1 Tax=Algibacillus agarilyticus TaxID=2234133 RepID=UPI000DCFCFDB|nr:chromosome segregation protein SMC [Algibacillus agarilyticus]
MRLKQIKLAGFKSFVDPTTVPFPAQMTAIVGPNGCGKSNIIDAVRWVLGESSAKNLRGDAMTDVIFNGSTSRKPISQASIELVFDNSEGRLKGEYAAFNEISIKRIVTREAVSTYLLNGAKCRKKDITELFLGTGLGPRSYAIIEQGMISRLIESKPQELRIFLEEAAGISKYKERRRETENRIKHTRDNLERLADVRAELQQQLEKLQKQASAAKRYKDLKSQERKLKAEHCVLRWMRLNNQTEALDKNIKQKQLALEALSTAQQGDQNQLFTLKTQQAELKHQLEQINQQLFTFAKSITRAEQQQLHLREKKAGLERNKNHQQSEKQNLETDLVAAEARLTELKSQFDDLLPELTMAKEEQDEAILLLEENEQQHELILETWQSQSQSFYQTDNKVKTIEAQLNALKPLMQKTQQRISYIQQDIKELKHLQSEQHDDVISDQIEIKKEQLIDIEHAFIATKQQAHQQQDKLSELEQQDRDEQKNYQVLNAELASLDLLIAKKSQMVDVAALSSGLAQSNINIAALLHESIKVEAGWEKAVDVVLQPLNPAVWVDTLLKPEEAQAITLNDEPLPAVFLFKESSQHDITSAKKRYATLADKVTAPASILAILSRVRIDADAKPDAEYSVIDQNGFWRNESWQYLAGLQNDSILAWKNERLEKQAHLDILSQHNAQTTKDLKQARLTLAELTTRLEQQKENIGQAKSSIQTLEYQQQIALRDRQETAQRLEKYTQELIEHQAALEDEQIEKIELEAALETAIQQKQLLTGSQENALKQKEHSSHALALARHKVDQAKTTVHDRVLKNETLKGQIDNATQAIVSAKNRTVMLTEQHEAIQLELNEIDMPLEDAAIQLQESLEAKAEVEVKQREFAQQLSLVEDDINTCEKDQHGVINQVQKIKDELASLQIEREGYLVRANSVLDSLNETGQVLKNVIETLPDDANEGIWLKELEKISTAIQRLGAINLAAIEEYDHQSERKNYLDAQHEDLFSALDTLESAIRKIDRETKAKFKQTFDSVNEDLQMLFPKVFGGGAAWLELTGDDLLDTGVTIMARPPGKRNSTIHLLSGGEKALTALSLVFAIFRLNPAPFCMLDEVDAPLDDANVVRFCRLVEEMSSNVQFIFISHNKIAMEMATNLVGVTMQEPGCSRMVAVDVDKAIALAEAS